MAGEDQVTPEDDRAIGRAVRFLFRTPERVIIIALLGTGGGLMGRSLMVRPAPQNELLPIIRSIQADTLEIKITNKAILSTLPKAAQQEAMRMIQIQMAAVAMANKERP